MSKYKINSISNLDKQLNEILKEIYINHSKDKTKLVNKKIFLSKRVCRFIGLPCNGDENGKEYPVKRVLKAYGGFPSNDVEIISYIFNKYGKIKNKYEIKNERKINIEKRYNNLINEFDDDFVLFLEKKFVNKEKILREENNIRKFYKTYNCPESPVLLSAFALNTVGDTHGLDKGKKIRGWFDDLLIFKYGDSNLENHNINLGNSNYIVTTYNVVENSSKKQENIGIIDIDNLQYVKNSKIHIIENNGVADVLFRKFPDMKIVLGSGFINSAVKKLIKKLLENENQLFYSGDLDYTGLKIADNLLKEFSEIQLELMDSNTYLKYKQHAICFNNIQSPSFLNNEDLKKVQDLILNNNNGFIYQESIRLK